MKGKIIVYITKSLNIIIVTRTYIKKKYIYILSSWQNDDVHRCDCKRQTRSCILHILYIIA